MKKLDFMTGLFDKSRSTILANASLHRSFCSWLVSVDSCDDVYEEAQYFVLAICTS